MSSFFNNGFPLIVIFPGNRWPIIVDPTEELLEAAACVAGVALTAIALASVGAVIISTSFAVASVAGTLIGAAGDVLSAPIVVPAHIIRSLHRRDRSDQ